MFLKIILFQILMFSLPVNSDSGIYKITISAGAFDRTDTVVSFYFPDEVQKGSYIMAGENDESVIIQVDENNMGWLILDELKAGESHVYMLNTTSQTDQNHAPIVAKNIDRNTITFQSADSDILSYIHGNNKLPAELDERYIRGGYIHPVYSPNGVLLTDHLNIDMHPHHYGIWSAWTHTEFQGRTPDFWNIQNNTGRVNQADSLENAWEGPVQSGFRAKHYFVDLSASTPVIALNEEWEVNVYPSTKNESYHIFDLTVTQTANTAQPLILPEYHYGGVAFRGHRNWSEPENVSFLTSEGFDRSNGNETRAKWTHIGGRVGEDRAGIAVLSHPGNYRAPQPVRIHPEIPYFSYTPAQLGSMSIEPGEPHIARYRYVAYDGEPNPEELDRLWNDYAYPPGVTVEKQ